MLVRLAALSHLGLCLLVACSPGASEPIFSPDSGGNSALGGAAAGGRPSAAAGLGGTQQSAGASANSAGQMAVAGDAGASSGAGGGSAGSGGGVSDGGALGAAGGAGGPSHAGRVPAFVAVGYGTRRVLSCDYGLTWPIDQADVPNGADDGYLGRGLAYGDGKFVAAVGGGGVQKLFTTTDGATWTRLDRQGNGFSDVAYGNGQFVAAGGHVSLASSDGIAWKNPGTMGNGGILRHATFGAFDGGRFVAVGDDGRRMNSQDGVAWGAQTSDGTGLNGVAFGAGRFVAISGGSATRVSEDGGATWSPGTIQGAAGVRGILFDGTRFIVTTTKDTFTSADGLAWQAHAANGGPARFDVSDDRKHYVGATGGTLYHSSDGLTFSVVKAGGQGLERVKFGWVSPSATCPL